MLKQLGKSVARSMSGSIYGWRLGASALPKCNFSQDKSLVAYESEVQKQLDKKYSKRKAKRDLVEELYFKDHSLETIDKELDDFLSQDSTAKDGQEGTEDELLDDMNRRLEELTSSYYNPDAEVNNAKYIFPETKEQVSEMIQQISLNDRLLKVYMKYRSLFGRKQISELLQKLSVNLNQQDIVRGEELKRYHTKVERLQKVNPRLTLKFKAIFLTKEELIQPQRLPESAW